MAGIGGTVTPFTDDEEDQDEGSLYSVGANQDDDTKLGPDGDGAASNAGSEMPQYSSRDSGATDPENNAPANSGGKSAGADPLAGSLYEPPPAAPQYQAPDRSQYKTDRARMQQDETPIDRNAKGVKPSITQRILAGLVGATGGAIGRDTSDADKILSQNYDRAKQAQDQRVGADKDVVAGDRQDITDAGTDQEEGRKYYDSAITGYNANRGAQGAEWDRQHTLRADQQAQSNADRTYQEGHDEKIYQHSEDTKRDDRADSEFKERQQQDQATRDYEGRRVSVEEKRLQDEENTDPSTGRPVGSPADQRIRAQNEQKYRAMRKDSFQKLNYGDPKANDEYHQKGFQASLKELQTSDSNPDTEEPWKPGEREAAVAQLKQRHVNELNGAEEDFVENMRGMGYKNIQPIQFDENGAAKTDSNGRPLQSAQSGTAPAPAAKPSAARPAQPPQSFRTRSGQQVNVGQVVSVGGKPYRITGVNPQTGKPTAVPVGP